MNDVIQLNHEAIARWADLLMQVDQLLKERERILAKLQSIEAELRAKLSSC